MKTDFNKKENEELQKLLIEKRNELQSFRFGIAGSRTKNVKAGRDLRRDIARLQTELATRGRNEAAQKRG